MNVEQINEHLADRIFVNRIRREWTQEHMRIYLAQAGLEFKSTVQIRMIEKGERKLTLGEIRAYELAFRCDLTKNLTID